MFRLVKVLKVDSKKVEEGWKGSDGKLCFRGKERSNVWKDCMEKIVNEGNYLGNNPGRDAIVGPVHCACREDVLQTLNELKTGKAPGPSDVSLEWIVASGEIGIHAIADLCIGRGVLDIRQHQQGDDKLHHSASYLMTVLNNNNNNNGYF